MKNTDIFVEIGAGAYAVKDRLVSEVLFHRFKKSFENYFKLRNFEKLTIRFNRLVYYPDLNCFAAKVIKDSFTVNGLSGLSRTYNHRYLIFDEYPPYICIGEIEFLKDVKASVESWHRRLATEHPDEYLGRIFSD